MITAYGPTLGRAQLRSEPEDFRVVEELGFVPSGSGEHYLLQVRKRGWTTPAVARLLAERCGVPSRQVAYAGLKDRHAETTQWLSLQLPGQDLPLTPGPLAEGVELLAIERNARKLRHAALRANRFALTLRAVDAPRRAVERRLYAIAQRGIPNYFGPQRFGRSGDNFEQARAWLLAGAPVRDRTLRGLLLSAVRSELFNRVLARRVVAGTWDLLLPGERAMLDGRGSHFAVAELDAALERRLRRGELHPSGPLAGQSDPADAPAAGVAALEQAVLAEEADMVAALQRRGLRAERRALRVMPRQLCWHWPATDRLVLCFALPPGAYATTLIAELFDTESVPVHQAASAEGSGTLCGGAQ
ncbi:tRNA pseudouridine(13) synthase TruD [Halorhodospira abdelmalekii]|uniref:tRNA pseudouridine(13) synthase TruD n=1 Tax=Halorhodospira abdelmalekii TaxID=421629 RepID=UPI001903D628|nr:tRNA pseudouridine(13) synthase TruD [Halorhodospira abdelmalekii]MBK1735890.1 tRNA pseudouridine(13) synthase TruD [Halorhodospira abdelmalekii]